MTLRFAAEKQFPVIKSPILFTGRVISHSFGLSSRLSGHGVFDRARASSVYRIGIDDFIRIALDLHRVRITKVSRVLQQICTLCACIQNSIRNVLVEYERWSGSRKESGFEIGASLKRNDYERVIVDRGL